MGKKQGKPPEEGIVARFVLLALPFLRLPDEINLSNPAMAVDYAQVHFTTNTGQTFHRKPISFSAAVLNNASNPQSALHFVEYLLSPDGQQLVQVAPQ